MNFCYIKEPAYQSECKNVRDLQFTMLSKEIQYKRHLMRDMGDNQMEPEGDLIIDGTTQEYDVYRDGRRERAYYTANLYPLGNREPILICHYGLQGSKIQYAYSSDTSKRHCRR